MALSDALDQEVGQVVATLPDGTEYRQVLLNPSDGTKHTTPDGRTWIAVHEGVVDGVVIHSPFTIHWRGVAQVDVIDKDRLLMLAAHEAESRPIRHTSVEIINYIPSKPTGPLLAPAGSVTVFVGPKGSSTISRIREAARSKDGTDVKVTEELAAQYVGRQPLSPDAASRLLQSQPVFGEIRYGCRTLANNIVVPPDLPAVFVASPYNGGGLSPEQLTLVEHVKEGSEASLEAVALRNDPPLTPAERAAMQKVPVDQHELNLAPNGNCCHNWTYIVLVVVFNFTFLGPFIPDDALHISEQELASLSPTATAIRLMDIRREALGHEHV